MADRGEGRPVLPLLPLRGVVVFPGNLVPLEVGRERSVAALEQAMLADQRVVLAAQRDPRVDEPGAAELHQWGVLARVNQLFRAPGGHVKVLVEAVCRARIEAFVQEAPFFQAAVRLVDEPVAAGDEVRALVRIVRRDFAAYQQLKNKGAAAETDAGWMETLDPGLFADSVAGQLDIAFERRQMLLETVDPKARLEEISRILAEEIHLLELEKRIQARVRQQVERSQREYYLREQIKAIQKELGEADEKAREIEAFKARIEAAAMPEAVKEKALHELGRLEKMPPAAAEAVVVRSYLEWLTALPWGKKSADRVDLAEAEAVLDGDHYGLRPVKERILEHLAVRRLAGRPKGPILCLVGPPGVGKTSLGRSIAKALGREFARVALGGVRDEAEIRGHRRTYVGAMPGKIAAALRQAGTMNPVILLDEIDKLGSDFRGDPASSLLEVLDPEQNHGFVDHYLEVPLDLSDVMFITTANYAEAIPRPLWDRMEVIPLSGYTLEEKRQIAKKHLLPKQREAHGLRPEQLAVSDNALRLLISAYTREAGVRGLERAIAALCRKAAREVLAGRARIAVSVRTLSKYLGPPRYPLDAPEPEDRVGVVHGLAYTEAGGGVIVIEASVAPGRGNLILTGKLGEVMRESAQTAYSYVRSRAARLGIDPKFCETVDVHVHVPEGAVPKEGPSAGISIAVALSSALARRRVRSDLAMTGEITLRGRVLPVGGIKEKVLAAHRARIPAVLVPKENEKDLDEVPAEVRRALTIHFVDHMDQVLELALRAPEPAKEPPGQEVDVPLGAAQGTASSGWLEQDAG